MIKLLRYFIFGLILFNIQIAYSQSFLRRENKKIVDGNGQEVILRGLGLGGWMLQEGYMMGTGAFASTQHGLKAKITELAGESVMNEFYEAWLKNHCTRSDIDSLAKWGFNSVRLPMHYNLFTLPIEKEPVAGQHTWLEKGFVMVDSVLKWCESNKMYLILDLHAAPGGQGRDAAISDYDNTKPSLWESAANRTKTVELWRKLAQRYANYSWIGGYDILNEPNWDLPGGTMLKQLYVDIIAAIRSVDKNHLIFIEGNWFANDFTGLLPSNASEPLMDPNMAYSFHKYWNGTGTGTIQWMLDIRNTYNVPIWLGESGENSNEWFARTIKTMEDNSIGWAWWPMKKIGSVVGSATIVETADYRTLINYWEKGGAKPTVDFTRNALLKIADNAKIENCIIHPDVIDALFRQVKQTTSLPFKTHKLPGTVFLTDYDLGKFNSAYWDTDYMNDKETSTQWNKGYSYRNDGVDIEKCNDTQISNGFNIGWTDKKEWMKYTVEVSETGYYDVSVRLAAPATNGMFHIEVNGRDATGTVLVPNTGGYQNWQAVTITDIPLEKGTNVLILKIDDGGFNLNSMTWTGPTAATSAPFRLLSAVTSEDGTKIFLNFNEDLKGGLSLTTGSFMLSNGSIVNISKVEQNTADTRQVIMHVSGTLLYTDLITIGYSGSSIQSAGGQTLGSFAMKPVVNAMLASQFIPGKIEAENFTENVGLSAEDCTDTGGGRNMGYTDAGDYLEYLVYVRFSGKYNVEVRYATPDNNTRAELALFNNGVKTSLVNIDFVATGGWQNWSTKTVSVNLPAGYHRLRYYVTTPRFNTNYLNFVNLTSSGKVVDNQIDFEVYPNPAKDLVTVKCDQFKEGSSLIEIIDVNGKVNRQKAINGGDSSATFDLTGNNRGMYFIRIKSEDLIFVKKLILD